MSLTVHAVEPNHGREETILSELLRVARKHVVMIEPSYEFASAKARERMDKFGYVRGLPETLKRLGYPARLVERWPHNSNPLNEAALIVVDKTSAEARTEPRFVSPISGRDLAKRNDCWFCPGGRSRVPDHCRNSVSDDGKRRAGEQARSILNKRVNLQVPVGS